MLSPRSGVSMLRDLSQSCSPAARESMAPNGRARHTLIIGLTSPARLLFA